MRILEKAEITGETMGEVRTMVTLTNATDQLLETNGYVKAAPRAAIEISPKCCTCFLEFSNTSRRNSGLIPKLKSRPTSISVARR